MKSSYTKNTITLAISFLFSYFIYSQDSVPPATISNTSIGARFLLGSYLTMHAKAEYLRDSYSSFTELYWQKKTDGSKDWQVAHNYPSWGVSLITGNTGSREHIGRLYALQPYFQFPLHRSSIYQAHLKLGGGAGWITKPYDLNKNPKNTLIGTHLNAFLQASLQNEFIISKHLAVDAGISLVHLSNGSTTLPNLGLNMPLISAGMRYTPSKEYINKRKLHDTSFYGINFSIGTSVSVKQAPWVGGKHYLINTLHGEAMKRHSRNSSYGGGMILFYNRSIKNFEEEAILNEAKRKSFQAGIYASYEHFLGKLSIPVHIGTYLYNADKEPFLFQQYGLRYRIATPVTISILLKSHMGQADFIHIGGSYNF